MLGKFNLSGKIFLNKLKYHEFYKYLVITFIIFFVCLYNIIHNRIDNIIFFNESIQKMASVAKLWKFFGVLWPFCVLIGYLSAIIFKIGVKKYNYFDGGFNYNVGRKPMKSIKLYFALYSILIVFLLAFGFYECGWHGSIFAFYLGVLCISLISVGNLCILEFKGSNMFIKIILFIIFDLLVTFSKFTKNYAIIIALVYFIFGCTLLLITNKKRFKSKFKNFRFLNKFCNFELLNFCRKNYSFIYIYFGLLVISIISSEWVFEWFIKFNKDNFLGTIDYSFYNFLFELLYICSLTMIAFSSCENLNYCSIYNKGDKLGLIMRLNVLLTVPLLIKGISHWSNPDYLMLMTTCFTIFVFCIGVLFVKQFARISGALFAAVIFIVLLFSLEFVSNKISLINHLINVRWIFIICICASLIFEFIYIKRSMKYGN